MGKFTVTFILLCVILAGKLFFLNLEPSYAESLVGILDIFAFSLLFVLGARDYLLNKKKEGKSRSEKKSIQGFIHKALLAVFLVVIGISIFLNANKKSFDWDAVALYDARAKFLQAGMKFSEMQTLSKYDNLNSYYYLLYPPYTSIAHYFWYASGVNLPVGLYYSANLMLLGLGIYFLIRDRLGKTGGILFAVLVVSNRDIFSISLVEYTNLPYTLHLVFGTFLLSSFFTERKKWQLYFGALLISSSQLVRFLEPMWVAIVLSLLFTGLVYKELKRNILPLALIIFVSVIQYFSWNFFVKSIALNPSIFETSYLHIIEAFLGIFTGSLLSVLSFFAIGWGLPLLIHIISITIPSVSRGKGFNKENLFLKGIISLSILIYFVGMYAISFQVDWWREMAGSLARSSTFLIPISGYLIFCFVIKSIPKDWFGIANVRKSLFKQFLNR